jgi:hypothetical protein
VYKHCLWNGEVPPPMETVDVEMVDESLVSSEATGTVSEPVG